MTALEAIAGAQIGDTTIMPKRTLNPVHLSLKVSCKFKFEESRWYFIAKIAGLNTRSLSHKIDTRESVSTYGLSDVVFHGDAGRR
jgi:hypothetical protein